jgi:hypothetical protein
MFSPSLEAGAPLRVGSKRLFAQLIDFPFSWPAFASSICRYFPKSIIMANVCILSLEFRKAGISVLGT